MKKRFIILLSLTIICISNVFQASIFAETKSELNISSKSAYLVEYHSGTVLYSKNENERLPIASMTKLMLLLLAFENLEAGNLSLTEKIIVSENASSMGGSQVFLEANGEYLCSDLIKSIIVASANDASVAMAERLYGSESECIDKMNERAKELSMNNTLYSNCTGLPKPTQYSCAKDVATLLQKVCEHEEYFEYSSTWIDEIKHPSGNTTGLTNTNKLVRFYAGCDGGKTGFTSEAGFCLSATAKRGGMRLVGVVIKADSSKDRFADTSSLFNYGFANYSEKCIFEKGQVLEEKAKVLSGVQDQLEISAKSDYFVFGKKNEKVNYTYELELDKVKAPIKKGDKVGKISVYIDNVKVTEIEVVANETVRKKSYIENIEDIANNW